MPKKQGKRPAHASSGKSGWCLGYPPEVYHERCPYEFSFGTCSCSCHKKEGKADEGQAD